MDMAKQKQTQEPPRQFGIFYPRGYVVITFETEDAAEQVRRALLDGGYDEEDVHLLDSQQVLEGATADLNQLSPLVRALGTEQFATEGHQSSAAAGRSFLVAYAPSELDTARLMNVAQRIGYTDAQKYDRFTVTRL
jgi:hypothetical protein